MITDLLMDDLILDAVGKYYTDETEKILKRPRMVIYEDTGITSLDILGEKIPDLCGPYTDELKERLDDLMDEKTKTIDRT